MYFYFAERFGFSPEVVDRIPLYSACLLMGAIGPDHTNVEMTPNDFARYYGNGPEPEDDPDDD